MARREIAAAIILCAGSVALHAQTAPQTVRARSFTTITQVPLTIVAADRSALIIAKKRPQALQLRTAIARLSKARVDLTVLDRSKVPVLISARPELLTNLKVFSATDRYTASTKQNGILIEINGTRLPAAAPKNFLMPHTTPLVPLKTIPQQKIRRDSAGHVIAQPPPDALRNVSIDRTSYGVDISFTRFGSVYNVTMDCGGETQDPEAIGPAEGAPSPAANDACSNDKALSLAKELEVAGGGETAQ